jgi:hypothetical protein
LKTVAGDGYVYLDWKKSSNNDGRVDTEYKIYRKNNEKNGTYLDTVENKNLYIDISVTNGEEYCYQITASNPAGESNRSNEACATPEHGLPDIIPPTIRILNPTNNENITKKRIQITGTASDNNGISRIEVSTDNKTWVEAYGKANWSVNLTLDNGLKKIYARALDISGNTVIVSIDITVKHPTKHQVEYSGYWMALLLISLAFIGLYLLLKSSVK